MQAIFKTYAAGLIGSIKFNLDIATGNKPVGISEDGRKIVQAQLWGAPEVIGNRILSNSVTNGKTAIHLEKGIPEEINYGPNHNRTHTTWYPTQKTQDNIREAIPDSKVADKIIKELTHTQSAYDDGEMGSFDVYKVDNPEQVSGNPYIRIKSMSTNTPSGRITRLIVSSIDKEGNVKPLDTTGNNTIQKTKLARYLGGHWAI